MTELHQQTEWWRFSQSWGKWVGVLGGIQLQSRKRLTSYLGVGEGKLAALFTPAPGADYLGKNHWYSTALHPTRNSQKEGLNPPFNWQEWTSSPQVHEKVPKLMPQYCVGVWWSGVHVKHGLTLQQFPKPLGKVVFTASLAVIWYYGWKSPF